MKARRQFLELLAVVGEAGLEILPGKDATRHASEDPSGKDAYGLNSAWTGGLPQGKWTRMDPLPGAITVNIGNMLMRLSDNLLKSTYHRVRAPLPGESLVGNTQLLCEMLLLTVTLNGMHVCRMMYTDRDPQARPGSSIIQA